MPLSRDRRNVAVLTVCQALFMTGQVMLISLNSLAGAMLADDKALATLPVSAVVVGTMLATVPASLLMRRIGRRGGFLVGVTLAMAGSGLAAWGLYVADFWTLVLGTFVCGLYGGFAQYYRFAATDAADPAFKSRAISLVVAGGVVAAVAGGELAKWSADLLAPYSFLGAYLMLIGLAAAAGMVLMALDIPRPTVAERADSGRPLIDIMRQPVFAVAVLGGMVGYGVMSLVMTATPLAMAACGFVQQQSTSIIQWHALGMFAPAFITGRLIARFGVLNIMMTGIALLALCTAVALNGVDLAHFWFALVALGIGWNFTFVSATTLLTEAYTPAERAKVQAANDFLVFGSVATASLSSGVVLNWIGWTAVQWLAIPFVVVAGAATLWLAVQRRAGRYPSMARGG